MLSFLQSWMVNPWLFAGGAVLISSPIIIHLLNKRRFKTVDWAAMDFLIEADKKNHRRIQLENLLLLLLRCLAVLLIGLLLARPFRPLSAAGGLFDTVRYERIVLLDDSVSMGARLDEGTAFQAAQKGLEQFLDGLADAESEDTLTVILASKPEKPVAGLNAVLVTEETKTEIIQRLRDLKLSDHPVDYQEAVAAIEKQMQGKTGEINRAVYILSDFRAKDWAKDGRGAPEMIARLDKIAERSAGCFLVNFGTPDSANLTVSRIVPVNKLAVAGVESEFDIFVRNHGKRDVHDVAVKFIAGASPPQTGTIRTIPAGEQGSVRFQYTFARPASRERQRPERNPDFRPDPVPIRAEVTTVRRVAEDRLPDDNVRYFAARVAAGVPVLLVDGDPNEEPNKTETFYLRRALRPHVERSGDRRSGVNVTVVNEDSLHNVKLDDYQIVYLCNLYRLGEDFRKRLERWVTHGGRLVICLGNQVDEEFFNRDLYRNGNGLSPVRLDGIRGDETEQKWTSFRIEDPNHPPLARLQADGVSFLQQVKVFQWWDCKVAALEKPATTRKTAGGKAGREEPTIVPLTLTGEQRVPAMVEQKQGAGRVVVLATACDADWSDWASHPTYLLFHLKLAEYLIPRAAEAGTVTVGQVLQHEFDLNEFDPTAEVETPGGGKRTVHSVQPAEKPDAASARLRRVRFAEAENRGFYRMWLTRTNGGKQNQLFAANVDANEGDLQPADQEDLRRSFSSASVRIVGSDQLASLGTTGVKGELWLWVLLALLFVLFLEQFLGWYFGTKR